MKWRNSRSWVGWLPSVTGESEVSISEGGDQSESDEEEVAQSEPMESVPSSEAEPMDVEMNDEDEVDMPTTPKFAPTARFSSPHVHRLAWSTSEVPAP